MDEPVEKLSGRDIKSNYLKDLRNEAHIRKDLNYKLIEISDLSMAELLFIDERCNTSKQKLRVLDGSSNSAIERAKLHI